MGQFEKLKKEYQDQDKVDKYDETRFKSFYQRIKNRKDWKALKRALKNVPDNGRLLNVPCGTGRFFSDLMKKDYLMVANDVSFEMLDYARKHYGDYNNKIVYQRTDIEKLPYKDKVFDSCIVVRFMHLIHDQGLQIRILQELKRVTSGWMIVSFHHRYTLRNFVRYLQGKGMRKLSYKQIRSITDGAGLKIKKIYASGMPLSSNWVLLLK